MGILKTYQGNTSPSFTPETVEDTTQYKSKFNFDKLDEEQLTSFLTDLSQSETPEYSGLDRDKFEDLVFGPIDPINKDIFEERAQAQSGWKLLGNAIGQGLTEATMGTMESIGYVLDFEELVNFDQQTTEGFDNWFSKGWREAKEYIQEEAFPVYQTQKATEGSLWERMGDGTFWASQGKTIGTTLSLLVPSFGIAKVAGMLGTAAELGTTGTNILQGVSAAMFSRKAESAMEANQTFQTEYNRLTNIEKLPDEVARLKAGQAAATVFKANARMLPMDMLQYTLALKSFSGLKKGLEAVKTTKGGQVISGLTQMGSEALEEGYQFVAQQEAVAQIKDGVTPFGTGFGERLSDYVEDPEFHTATFLGAAMGGFFGAVSSIARKAAKITDEYTAKKLTAANLGDFEAFNKIDNKIQADIIIKNLLADRLDTLNEELDISEQEFLTNPDLSEEEKKEISQKISKFKENVSFVKEADNYLQNIDKFKNNPKARKQYSLLKLEDKIIGENINNWQAQLNKLSEIIDPRDNAVIDDRNLSNLNKELDVVKKDNTLTESQRKQLITTINDKIQQVEESLANNIELSKTIDKTFDVKKYSTPNIEKIEELSYKIAANQHRRDKIIRPSMAQFEIATPKQITKKEKDITKNIKTKVENLNREQAIEEQRIKDEASEADFNAFNKAIDEMELEDVELFRDTIEASEVLSDNHKKLLSKRLKQKLQDLQTIEAEKVQKSKLGKPSSENIEGEGVAIESEVIEEGVPESKFIGTDTDAETMTSLKKDESEIDEEPVRLTPKTEQTLEETQTKLEKEIDRKTTVTNLAYKAVKSVKGDNRSTLINNEGDLEFIENTDHRTSLPNYYTPGTPIVMFIDKNYKGTKEKGYADSYENTKDDVNSIPIGIQLKSEYGIKEHTMWLHDMAWINKDNVAEDYIETVKAQTKALREFLFANQDNKYVNVIADKSAGSLNRTKIDRTIREIIVNDTRPYITFGSRTGNLTNTKGEKLLNKEYSFVPGIPYLVLPMSNGEFMAVWLRQEDMGKKINGSYSPEYINYIDTIQAMLEAYANGTLGINEIHAFKDELNKYFYVNEDKSSADTSRNMLFQVWDLKDGVNIQLVSKTRINNKGEKVGYRDYNFRNGSWYRVENGGVERKLTKAQMKSYLLSKLNNKYPNIIRKAAENPDSFEVFKLQENNLIKVKQNYLDFLSENKVVTARLKGQDVTDDKGNTIRTYTSQPNIAIGTNVSKLVPLERPSKEDVQEKISKPLEVIEKVTNFDEFIQQELNKIDLIPISEDLISYAKQSGEITEETVNEAVKNKDFDKLGEMIKNYCKRY